MAGRLNGEPSEFGAFHYGSVCPWGIVTDFSRHLWAIYNACDGYKRLQTPDDYYRLPGLYVEACNVFDRVRSEIPPE